MREGTTEHKLSPLASIPDDLEPVGFIPTYLRSIIVEELLEPGTGHNS
jgi:hypothetical protein